MAYNLNLIEFQTDVMNTTGILSVLQKGLDFYHRAIYTRSGSSYDAMVNSFEAGHLRRLGVEVAGFQGQKLKLFQNEIIQVQGGTWEAVVDKANRKITASLKRRMAKWTMATISAQSSWSRTEVAMISKDMSAAGLVKATFCLREPIVLKEGPYL